MLYHHQSIGLAEKRLFPLNYTPKRSQSLKTIDFVPVADFTPNPVFFVRVSRTAALNEWHSVPSDLISFWAFQ